MGPQPVKGEPLFSTGAKIKVPKWENPATVQDYNVRNGSYSILGPGGGQYRLVIIESGYKLIYGSPDVEYHQYTRGQYDFDEVVEVE